MFRILAACLLVSLSGASLVGCSTRPRPADTTVYSVAKHQLPAEDPYSRKSFVQPPVNTKLPAQSSNAPLIQPAREEAITVAPKLPLPRRKY
jgi:hypothetical protein